MNMSSSRAAAPMPADHQRVVRARSLDGGPPALRKFANKRRRVVAVLGVVAFGLLGAVPALPAAADTPSGTVVGWGFDDNGQLSQPAGLTGVVAISAAFGHSLALKSDGTVVGWGRNSSGQATPPTGLTGVTAISAGQAHSLALTSDATVVGWGLDFAGAASSPAGLTGVVAIDAGYLYSLALKSDGTVVGWGDNLYGQATPPTGLTGVVAISAGQWHSLALKSDGTVVSWGLNADGQATPPTGLTGVTAISAGFRHSLALKSDGTAVGWGRNTSGQATPPTGLTGVAAIEAGGQHNLALKSDGTVVGWGSNSRFDGGTTPPPGQATPPTGLTGVTAIAAGFAHSLAIVDDAQPPTLNLPGAMAVEATGADGATVNYTATASDNADPNPTVSCTPASGATFPLGTTTVACTASDASGNTASATFAVSVTYSWSGVLKPIKADGSSVFRAGRTIPVKFALTGASAPVSTATATLTYAKFSNGIKGSVVDATTKVGGTTGNLFRYTGGQYIFNWSTKGLTAGTYSLGVDLGDGAPHAVTITLK